MNLSIQDSSSTMSEFSPAAQAVLDAFRTSHTGQDCLAAALRAAADQVVPVPIKAETSEEHWALLGAKNRLLAIADELEASEVTS